jgi:hypothetical protein
MRSYQPLLLLLSLLYLQLEDAQAFQGCFVKLLQKQSLLSSASSSTSARTTSSEFAADDPSPESSINSNSPRRRRSISSRRKPNYYWNDIRNVRTSFYEFWEDLNVTTTFNDRRLPPAIPSEALLNHFERYDLRQVIIKYGGREFLSEQLGGAEIIPGKWKDAVGESYLVKELVKDVAHGLHADLPPLSPQQKKKVSTSQLDTDNHGEDGVAGSVDTSSPDPALILLTNRTQRWSYKNKETRKPMRYWSLPVLIEELYEYLDDVCLTQQRPAVWMPRPSEIQEAGREDLFHALARFGRGSGKKKDIAAIAGLVPYRECRYFEDQLQLMKDLTRYLDEHYGGNHAVFPTGSEIKENGYMSLYYAIQRYGGRKFLMSRFGMVPPGGSSDTGKKKISLYMDLSFGPFSIDFAIDLLEYIRNHNMQLSAPLRVKPATIRMPTEYELFQNGRNDLIEGIQKYGGYENVARRLGLAYFDAKPPPGGSSPSTGSNNRRFLR